MRNFDLHRYSLELLKPDIVNLISSIHEYRGKQDLFMEAKPDILKALLEIAKIQSTGASNRKVGVGRNSTYIKNPEKRK